jgi:xanthine dehydrogenase small subunit
MYDYPAGSEWLRQPAADADCGRPADRVNGLRALQRDKSLQIECAGKRFFAPLTTDELAGLLADFPDAILLAGGTDIGLWVTKEHRELETVIYTGRIEELRQVNPTASHIEIGAAASITDAMTAMVAHYPDLDELFRRFASPPIRNAATLGGNIANGSPIGDSMPALMVAGTTLILRRGRSRREVPLDAFYLDYRVSELREAEFIESIHVPVLRDAVILRSHKWSKRFDQDISAVCTAYCLELDGDRVSQFRMACGGMAATVKRAANCEAAVAGKPWSEATIEAACDALAQDYTPITDMRASAGGRLLATQNLLRRFYHETSGNLEQTVYAYGR